MNTWACTGTVRNIASRAAGSKTVHQLAVAIPGREREGLAVFDWWDSPPEIGTVVFATGTVAGREYQGKYYAGLTAHELHVLRPAGPATPAPAKRTPEPPAESARTETQDDIPF
jgi:hypothetical protein